MSTITIMDPVTRIEGHLKVEVQIDPVGGENKIVDARCTGTLFRGFETILLGRDPKDAPVITQRICGVCPVSHGMASTLALESAAAQKPPANARILRNLVLGSNYLQSHILHFYVLAALDYIKGPQTSPWIPAWEGGLKATPLDGIIVERLGQALEARKRAHEMGAIFGGRMPLPHATVPGGFTATPSSSRFSAFLGQLNWLTNFIESTYIPDVNALAAIYPEYKSIGVGFGNLIAFGAFNLSDTTAAKLFKRGYVLDGSGTVNVLNTGKIAEHVTHSWYTDATNNLRPAAGLTEPLYPKDGAYSWLKAPRYDSKPFEAGPLARMWVNGDYREGVSVMDRHKARALEALKVAKAMRNWLQQLKTGNPVYSEYLEPVSGDGIGLTEAPRGALGHWVSIANGKLAHYQVITPTCWNASPRDTRHIPGPMEKALIGTPVADPEQPIEALRVIHSFDPCLSCAVHVMRPLRKPIVIKARS
jgi:hydrogenase large subunit